MINAFAGVGKPIKFSLCLISTLNLASLNPENTAIISGMNVNSSNEIEEMSQKCKLITIANIDNIKEEKELGQN